MHQLVIRGGLVADGTGAEPRDADIAIDDGNITRVDRNVGRGAEEFDAKGLLVTPGFVDLHTHYDAQVMWDPILAPSAWHGVTTVITGNCAVGFAPTRPGDRDWIVSVMESVEEIPRKVMDAGLRWDWETYSEYLDALARRRHTVDIGTQLPHIPLRAYVMGERAERDEPSTAGDIAAMSRLVEEALHAGALAFSCTRTTAHKLRDGRLVPGSYAPANELLALSEAVGRVGDRVIQYLGNVHDLDNDLELTVELARRSRLPIHFVMSDTRWQDRLAAIEAADRDGLTLYGHVAPRAVGSVLHWRAARNPFSPCPSVKDIGELPWEAKLERLSDLAFKAQVISEYEALTGPQRLAFDRVYEVSNYPEYEPDPTKGSIAAGASKVGQDPASYAYDVLMGNEGQGMIYVPIANYSAGDLSEVREMLLHPNTVVSLGDGGAHCTRVADASNPTFMLTHWARDRSRGEKLPLGQVVRSLSRDTAFSYGLRDRGLIAPGYLADLNVIDFDRLRLPAPYTVFDFPAGGQRLLQKAEGYVATFKRGEITFRDGEHTGRFPGAVLRGPRAAPP